MSKRSFKDPEDPNFSSSYISCASSKAPENTVDEASEESFPASDAPAWTTHVKNADAINTEPEHHFTCHQCGKDTQASSEYIVKGENCFIHFCCKRCYDKWRLL